MKYRVIAIQTGYAVAYEHAVGGWTSVSEHCVRESAQAEVERLNLGHQTAVAIAASSLQKHREHAFPEWLYTRRSARYFEDDAFA